MRDLFFSIEWTSFGYGRERRVPSPAQGRITVRSDIVYIKIIRKFIQRIL